MKKTLLSGYERLLFVDGNLKQKRTEILSGDKEQMSGSKKLKSLEKHLMPSDNPLKEFKNDQKPIDNAQLS